MCFYTIRCLLGFEWQTGMRRRHGYSKEMVMMDADSCSAVGHKPLADDVPGEDS